MTRGLRALARRHTSPETRAKISRRGSAAASWVGRQAANVISAPFRFFPDSLIVEIRERLAMRRRLDFTDSDIDLVVTSQVERRTRLWSCRKEPETVEWLKKVVLPGSVVYDIGANVGAYSLIAGRLLHGSGGAVYAFEPGYRSYANLVDNVLINGLSNTVFPLPIAANDATALAMFQYSDTSAGSANHTGLGEEVNTSAAVQTLLGCSLDDAVRIFSLRSPTAMKIDVDGAEVAVVSGARGLLSSEQLKDVLVETDLGSPEWDQIAGILGGAGFSLVAQHRRGEGAAHNFVWARQ